MVMGAEFLVDWIKHAFITRFNEVDADVYKSYTIFLAYDLAQTKQKHVSFWNILDSLVYKITQKPDLMGICYFAGGLEP